MSKRNNTDIADTKVLNKRIISTVFGLAALARLDADPDSEVLQYVKEHFVLGRRLYCGIEPEKPDTLPPPFAQAEVKHCEEEVRGFLKNKTVREKICSALQPGVRDLFDTANALAPVFITLSATGVIATPLTPLLFVVAAVLLLKIGVAGFCAGLR
jgi:hypothetical protein